MWYFFLVLPGIYMLFCCPAQYKRYMTYIGISFFMSMIFCLIFPNGQNLRPDIFPRDNIFTSAVKYLYTIDTNTNVCPSVHVVGAMAPVFASFDGKTALNKWRPTFIVLCVLITMSTVFLKQHSVLDIIVSPIFIVIPYFLVYKVIFGKIRKI